MTIHPNQTNDIPKWKQSDIILFILEEHEGTKFTVDDIIDHMRALGYAERKMKRPTLQAVLSRLHKQTKIKRNLKGEYSYASEA
jgi:hypothetical protein